MNAGCQGIEDDEGDARAQAWPVAVETCLDRTYFERAIAIGPEEDNVRGEAPVIRHVVCRCDCHWTWGRLAWVDVGIDVGHENENEASKNASGCKAPDLVLSSEKML